MGVCGGIGNEAIGSCAMLAISAAVVAFLISFGATTLVVEYKFHWQLCSFLPTGLVPTRVAFADAPVSSVMSTCKQQCRSWHRQGRTGRGMVSATDCIL